MTSILSLPGFTLHFMPARDTATVADLTLLVRTPNHLNGYKAFTEQQAAEAAEYAHSQGVEVERLP